MYRLSTTLAPGLFALVALFLCLPAAWADFTQTYCSSQNTASDAGPFFWTWQSNGWCHDKCLNDYAFAVVLGNDCWCSNYIPSDQADVGDCSDECPGFPSEDCGNKGKKLYGYVKLNLQPSGTQGSSQPTSAKVSDSPPSSSSKPSSARPPPEPSSEPIPSAAPPSPPSSAPQRSDPATVIQTVTASARVVTLTPTPSSADPTTLATSTVATTSSTQENSKGDDPEPTPFTEVKTLTVGGTIVTQTVVNTPTNAAALNGTEKKSTNVGAIVGGVVAGLAVLAAIVGGIFFILRRRRRRQNEDNEDGQSGVQRNVSTMSKAGLLRGEKQPQYPPPIVTSFNRRNSRHMDTESVSPISGSDRRSSRPYLFDQRLNPSAIMAMDNGSRGSFASLDDSRDYGRELNVRNPDPPRESVDDRKP
ncbi:hypothetical protein EJ04DRAFT_173131 [Polyplosphaeria fusca]|uniref:WSC domain-containing protein n=1 Tax=Polyplosphaeria fusca TaxID=682080 RepID=A0A9P4V4C8_9PLEO|nr:hypothetical protein EJ04DRAFT_173131 [Polyplosphaeria fusca]